jgi:hypothetical protein
MSKQHQAAMERQMNRYRNRQTLRHRKVVDVHAGAASVGHDKGNFKPATADSKNATAVDDFNQQQVDNMKPAKVAPGTAGALVAAGIVR